MSEINSKNHSLKNSTDSSGKPKDRTKYFYSGAALFLLALSLWGFHWFYFHGKAYPGRPLTPEIRTIVITHGTAMMAWLLLSIIQPFLVTARKYKLHMTLGKAGAVLAVCVFFSGVTVAIASAKVNPPQVVIWGFIPKQFMAVSLSSIILFAVFVAVGIWKRLRAEIHRPMMLLASLTATSAAIDRIDVIKQTFEHTLAGKLWGPYFPAIVIGAGFLLTKSALKRSLDRFFLSGFAVIVMTGLIVMKLAAASSWDGFAAFLLR